MNKELFAVIGAGPAGLAAALELAERGVRPILFESGAEIGGLARTVPFKGCLFDIGGHRFFTKNSAIDRLWHRMLGPDFIPVKRSSRIFYNGRFFDYPLKVTNTLRNLGGVESARILSSYLRSQLFPNPREETFEQWMCNRFGMHLYRVFFKTYTEKVWGIPCSEMRAEWAGQRIKGLSMTSIVTNALFGTRSAKTLTDRFHYPTRGPGMMWERIETAVSERGGDIQTGAQVIGLTHADGRITSVRISRDAVVSDIPVHQVISSMPITQLVNALDPAPPEHVRAAAARLSYRALIMVGLILDRDNLFPDQWIYIHASTVRVGRIQNFKNWSPDMAQNGHRTNIGMEYFCNEGDGTWTMTDAATVEMASRELETLGLARRQDVIDALVIRQPKAYPVYDNGYRPSLDVIRRYLQCFDNLQTIGRNGTHRYNNMDQAMSTGIIAARNSLGAHYDLWEVTGEDEYLEETGGRRDDESAAENLFSRVFTRMDKFAFGTAVGAVTGMVICLATLWLVIKGGPLVGPKMRLLAQFFFGYTVTVKGAAIGSMYGFITGFFTGWLFAFLRNLFFALYLYKIRKTAEFNSLKDLLDRI
ncbi:MAG: FAD-dependent oxidoreductase [Pseudomonadota bacterium]